MAFQPAPDCVLVQLEGSLDGQQTINDLSFRSTIGPRTAADVIELLTAIADWYTGQLVPFFNIAWQGRRAKAKGLSNENAFAAEISMIGSDGLVTGEAMPNNVTMSVSFQTGLSGRSHRGRNYVPGLSDSIVDGNIIDSSWAASIATAYQGLVFPSEFVPDGWVWVIISRQQDGVVPAEALFFEVVLATAIDLVVDSQRRRLPGRGR